MHAVNLAIPKWNPRQATGVAFVIDRHCFGRQTARSLDDDGAKLEWSNLAFSDDLRLSLRSTSLAIRVSWRLMKREH